MVSCSVAAFNTEAQGAQESLSKVRDLQGAPGLPRGSQVNPAPWGHRAIPLPLGRAAFNKPKHFVGLEVSNIQMCPEVGTEGREGTSW